MTTTFSLDALNFALAGAREGFGPFLGVFLQHQGFDPARTGFAMSLAGLAGILATGPLGALIDRIKSKRAAMVVAVTAIAVGAGLIVATKQLWLIAVGQMIIGVADSGLAPLMAALTLGLVGRSRYADRVSRNEAWNHAGNAVNAALAAALGTLLGLGYVAAAIAVMAAATTMVMLTVRADAIDHEEARGGGDGAGSAWKVLRDSRPLLLLAATVFAFQAANGAMLPFIAQALAAQGHDPSLTTGAMAVTAQVTMIVAALGVPGLSRSVGHRKVLALALLLVVIRSGLAAWSASGWSVGAVQVLEGLAMGLAGVAIPAIVAEIMSDTGHANAGLGAVMTAFGAGAALSPALAGLVAQKLGFPAAFLALGSVAAVGLAGWLFGLRLPGIAQAGEAPTPAPTP